MSTQMDSSNPRCRDQSTTHSFDLSSPIDLRCIDQNMSKLFALLKSQSIRVHIDSASHSLSQRCTSAQYCRHQSTTHSFDRQSPIVLRYTDQSMSTLFDPWSIRNTLVHIDSASHSASQHCTSAQYCRRQSTKR